MLKAEFRDSRELKDELEVKKAIKRARMGLAHVIMYEIKMKELSEHSTEWNKPLNIPSINRKKDDDFIYF